MIGCIEINPGCKSLEEVAILLNKNIEGVELKRETSGRFEEFPAYISSFMGSEMALLGIPEPEYDIRDEKKNIFVIQFSDFMDLHGIDENTLLTKLKSLLSDRLDLDCRIIA